MPRVVCDGGMYLGVAELVAGLHGVEGVVDAGQPHVGAGLAVHRHLHALARAVLAVVHYHRELSHNVIIFIA